MPLSFFLLGWLLCGLTVLLLLNHLGKNPQNINAFVVLLCLAGGPIWILVIIYYALKGD